MNRPSDYTSIPMGSTLQNFQSEMIAKNIMVILSRTGNTFRPLSWEEYKEERLKDTGFSEIEKPVFEKVIKYCKSPDTAVLLKEDWAHKVNEKPTEKDIDFLLKKMKENQEKMWSFPARYSKKDVYEVAFKDAINLILGTKLKLG